MEANIPKTVFIVEHMEPYLFEWCMYEYLSMKSYLKGFNTELWITNTGVIYDYHGEEEHDNQKYLKELEEAFADDKGRLRLVK